MLFDSEYKQILHFLEGDRAKDLGLAVYTAMGNIGFI